MKMALSSASPRHKQPYAILFVISVYALLLVSFGGSQREFCYRNISFRNCISGSFPENYLLALPVYASHIADILIDRLLIRIVKFKDTDFYPLISLPRFTHYILASPLVQVLGPIRRIFLYKISCDKTISQFFIFVLKWVIPSTHCGCFNSMLIKQPWMVWCVSCCLYVLIDLILFAPMKIIFNQPEFPAQFFCRSFGSTKYKFMKVSWYLPGSFSGWKYSGLRYQQVIEVPVFLTVCNTLLVISCSALLVGAVHFFCNGQVALVEIAVCKRLPRNSSMVWLYFAAFPSGSSCWASILKSFFPKLLSIAVSIPKYLANTRITLPSTLREAGYRQMKICRCRIRTTLT